jgi:RNA polymerase sigma factor (sigma-70 family)
LFSPFVYQIRTNVMEQVLTIDPMSIQSRNDSIQQAVRKERSRLLRFIRRKVSSDEDAEDILQDVLYQFVNAAQFDFIDKTAAWLFKTANNRIIDWYRKHKPVSLDKLNDYQTDKSDENNMPIRLEDILFDPTEDPDLLYLRSTVWPLLSEALDEMPEEQSSVFIMHELEKLSFKEIAELTGAPVNTLISRKRYAVMFLRERLQELYNEFFNE